MTLDILLVEDEPGDARLVKEAFGSVSRSTSIHVVTTSQEAVDFLTDCVEAESATIPDILLLDLRLPGDDGFSVVRGVRKDLGLDTLPVLVLTSSDADEDAIRSYQLHANAYLRKPDDLNEYEKLAQEVITFWGDHNQLPPE